MKRNLKRWSQSVLLIIFTGCTGMSRSCASCNAESFGANWVVVQMDNEGRPYRCWSLRDVSIANEGNSDGIYWKDSTSENLIHISGHYNRVQVAGANWGRAYHALGLTQKACNEIHDMNYDPTTRTFEPTSPKAESAK